MWSRIVDTQASSGNVLNSAPKFRPQSFPAPLHHVLVLDQTDPSAEEDGEERAVRHHGSNARIDSVVLKLCCPVESLMEL